ncbi:MAG: hypothetical protein JST98_06135 [Bacteroidetes bacterium]|nr:hypothetical protein [Bacteroidota bacterium]
MPRRIIDIYDAMALEKADQQELAGLQPDIDSSQQLLADLDSPSQVARWRLMLWVVATAIWVHERLWEVFRAEVDAIMAAAHPGTPKWYVAQAKAFQLGYALTDVDGVYRYTVDDPSAKVVKRAAIVESNGLVILKVATVVGGAVVPLASTDMDAFKVYMDQIKFAGTVINFITDDSDLLRVGYDVYYDPLVLAPNGSLLSDAGVFPVREAIEGHIAALPFNGTLVLTHLTDAVQRAAGVLNPVLTDAKARWGAFAPATIAVSYVAHAGHMAIDPMAPLAATINYIPAT